MNCPLCLKTNHSLYEQDKQRSFFQCATCELIFVPRDQLLSSDDEFKRYKSHQNSEKDPHYLSYLKKNADAALPILAENSTGLDFGCGETNLLAKIFTEAGHATDSYDLYFYPEEKIWNKNYDFIILSEVIEHLAAPRELMMRLSGLLNPNGKIFIKTKYHPGNPKEFGQWFYKRDQTHVQFFNNHSMEFLAELLKMKGPLSMENEDLYLIYI